MTDHDHGALRRLAMAASATCAIAITPWLGAQERPGPSITDLGTLGGSRSWAFAINANGLITGSADVENAVWRGYVSDGSHLIDLGTLPEYRLSGGNDINNRGVIVGQSYYLYDGEAVVWDRGGIQSLGLYANLPRSEARGVNDDGVIVGYAWDDLEYELARPVLWRDREAFELGTPKGHTGGRANAVNNDATIVGDSWNEDRTEMGAWMMVDGGVVTALPGLGGAESGTYSINARGQIAGYARDKAEIDRPVLWMNGEIIQLEHIEDQSSRALGINNRGVVVGFSFPEGADHADAVLWQNGVMHNLNDLLSDKQRAEWELFNAEDINERGQIVGIGLHNGESHAYRLEL